MVDRSRKVINALTESDLDLEDETLGSAAARIQKLISRYGVDAKIKKYSPGYSDSEYLGIYVDRPETDQEMNRRIAEEERADRYREERDRLEFERLSAKFNKKG